MQSKIKNAMKTMQMMQIENWVYLKSTTYCNFTLPILHCLFFILHFFDVIDAIYATSCKTKNAMKTMQMMQNENWVHLNSTTYCNFTLPIGH